MIHKIPAQDASEKSKPISIIEAPEMDKNLKLFFIVIGFTVFMRTDARHFFKG
jgi:hypothetical protein